MSVQMSPSKRPHERSLAEVNVKRKWRKSAALGSDHAPSRGSSARNIIRFLANSVTLSSLGVLRYGISPKTSIVNQRPETYVSGSSSKFFRIRAVQENEGPRRLVDIIRIIPEASRNYFRSPSRRALFGGISLLGGFYVAQTISLSFGALGVNDVFAAVLCVLITEYVTRFYYSRPKVTFPVALLNNFKMGFTYGLFIDAFKLAS